MTRPIEGPEQGQRHDRDVRIARTQHWLGAQPVSDHGVPIPETPRDTSEDFVNRVAQKEAQVIRRMLEAGTHKVSIAVQDPLIREAVLALLTPEEKGKVSFG